MTKFAGKWAVKPYIAKIINAHIFEGTLTNEEFFSKTA